VIRHRAGQTAGSSVPVRLDNRVAVVTGAGRGLGREFALELAARGAAVVVNDIGVSADASRYVPFIAADHGEPAEEEPATVAARVAAEIGRLGGSAVANAADVAEEEGARSIVADAIRAFGRVDIVVNNAGVVITAPFEDLTADDLATVQAVHVRGSFNVARQAWPHLVAQEYGRIVNVCSVEGGLIGSPQFAAYAAAKGGLIGLTFALARDGDRHGIQVNGILPAAATRASALSGKKRAPHVDRSPALVAAGLTWLCHENCDASGRLYALTAGSMRMIFNTVTTGYVFEGSGPVTPEEVRDRWEQMLRPGTGRI